MLNEANAVYSHSTLCGHLAGSLRAAGIACARELRLPNGKIADIAYSPDGNTVHLVECKIDFRPVHLMEAAHNYGPFCHYLWIAVPSNSALPAVIRQPQLLFRTVHDDIGIISVSHNSTASYRKAELRRPAMLDIVGAQAMLTARLTAGETAPALKTADRAERAKNDSAGHESRRCQV